MTRSFARRWGSRLILIISLVSRRPHPYSQGMEQRRRASDTNKLLMERIYAAINSGQIDAADDVVAEDIVEHEEFPGVEQGREGFKQYPCCICAGCSIGFVWGDHSRGHP